MKNDDQLVRSLLAELRDNSCAVASFASDLKHYKEDIVSLSKVVRDGNGQPSLLVRVNSLEQAVVGLVAGVEKLTTALKEATKDDKQAKATLSGSRLAFWASIIAAFFAMIATIITVFAK